MAKKTPIRVKAVANRKRKLKEEEPAEDDSSPAKKGRVTRAGPAKKLVVKMPFSAGTRQTPRRKVDRRSANEESEVGKKKKANAGEKVSTTTCKQQKGTAPRGKVNAQGRGRPRKVALKPTKPPPGRQAKAVVKPSPNKKAAPTRPTRGSVNTTAKKIQKDKSDKDTKEATDKKVEPTARSSRNGTAESADKAEETPAPVAKEATRKTARIIKSPIKAGMVETNPVNILGTGSRKRGRPPKAKEEKTEDETSPKKKKVVRKKGKIAKGGNAKAGKKKNADASSEKKSQGRKSNISKMKKKSSKSDSASAGASPRHALKFSVSNTQVLQDNLLAPLPELPETFLSDSSNTDTSGSDSTQPGKHSLGGSSTRGSSLSESYPVLAEAMQTKSGVVFLDHSYATATIVAVKPPKVVHPKQQKSEVEQVRALPKAKKTVGNTRKRSISESSLPKQTIIKLNRAPSSPVKPPPSASKILYTMNPQQVPKTLPQQIFATPTNPAPSVSPSTSSRSLILPQTLKAVQAGGKITTTQPKVITIPVAKGVGTQSVITLPAGGQILAQSTKSSEGGKIITLPVNTQSLITQSNVVTVPVKGTRAPIAQNPNVITMSMGNTSPISPSNLTAIQLGTNPPKGAKRISFTVGVPQKAASSEKADADNTNKVPASSPKQRSA